MNRLTSVAALAVLALAACSQGPGTPPADAGAPTDTGAPASDTGSLPSPDTGASASPDAGAGSDAATVTPPDAGGPGMDATVFWADGSVSGTPLEKVTIDCPAPLDLCTRWQEGAAVAEELARHAHVALPKLVRAGLQPWQLASASVDGLLVERGNLDAQRSRPPAGTVGRALRKYSLSVEGGYTHLEAEVAHDLGAAGVLVESYNLYRDAQGTQPITLDASTWEVGFSLELPGVANPISLEVCDGGPEMDAAVEVLRATRGSRHLVVTRFMNTRLAMAGSYPVHVAGVQLAFTDSAWAVVESGDWFAHTYVAQHHNWDEESVIDLTQEPRLYHTVFRPIAEGQTGVPTQTPERVELHGVNGWSVPPYLDVTLRNANGTTATERWDVQGQLVRVDDVALTMAARSYCSDAEVFLVGFAGSTGYTSSFQMLTCPQAAAPGYALKAVVPTWFTEDPTLIGKKIEGAAISPTTVAGRPGHSVKLGAYTATITTADGKQFFVTVKDGAGQALSDYLTEASELGPYPVPMRETLKAEDGKGISMVMERQWAGQGVGESSIFAPLSFQLTFGGRTVLVDSMDMLRYTNTHHNWADGLEARGEGLVLKWRTRYIDGVNHEVAVDEAGGVSVVPWTVLK